MATSVLVPLLSSFSSHGFLLCHPRCHCPACLTWIICKFSREGKQNGLESSPADIMVQSLLTCRPRRMKMLLIYRLHIKQNPVRAHLRSAKISRLSLTQSRSRVDESGVVTRSDSNGCPLSTLQSTFCCRNTLPPLPLLSFSLSPPLCLSLVAWEATKPVPGISPACNA